MILKSFVLIQAVFFLKKIIIKKSGILTATPDSLQRGFFLPLAIHGLHREKSDCPGCPGSTGEGTSLCKGFVAALSIPVFFKKNKENKMKKTRRDILNISLKKKHLSCNFHLPLSGLMVLHFTKKNLYNKVVYSKNTLLN